MKRLIAAVIMLIILVTLCCVATVGVQAKCNNMIAELESAEKSFIGGNKNAFNDFNGKLDKNLEFMCIFNSRAELDEISFSSVRLTALSQAGDTAAALSECKYLIKQIKDINEQTKITIYSFF